MTRKVVKYRVFFAFNKHDLNAPVAFVDCTGCDGGYWASVLKEYDGTNADFAANVIWVGIEYEA